MSMNVYNDNGESSSLGKAAMGSYWNTNKARGDGTVKMVPIITLSSIINAIPSHSTISLIKTDMQGFDFVAIKEAGPVLKEKVTHIMTEVWHNDIASYYAENDLCRDWLPFMTKLGYVLVKTRRAGTDIAKIKADCEKQLKDKPERPEPLANAGMSEGDAYWIREDAVDKPFPDNIAAKGVKAPTFSEAEYATC